MGPEEVAVTFVGYEETCTWNCKKNCTNQSAGVLCFFNQELGT
jgi:hypothetical protein